MAYHGRKPEFLQARITELALPRGTDVPLSAGNNNNLSLGTNSYTTVSSAAAATITGIASPSAPVTSGKIYIIKNANTAQDIVIANQNTNSTAANRIITGTGLDITLPSGASVLLNYDDNVSRWGVIGIMIGTSTSNNTKTITQTTHGFVVGDWVGLSGTTYVKAVVTTATNHAVGVVSQVVDTNNFVLTTDGYVSGLSGLTAGSRYYISTTAGAIIATAPLLSGTNVFQQEVFEADTTTSGYVMISAPLFHASATIDGLVATDAQTWAGEKTFNNDVRFVESIRTDQTSNATAGTLTDFDASNSSSIIFTAATTIDTLVSKGSGHILAIINGNSSNLIIKHEGAGTAANRITSDSGNDIIARPNQALILQYNGSTSRWNVLANPEFRPISIDQEVDGFTVLSGQTWQKYRAILAAGSTVTFNSGSHGRTAFLDSTGATLTTTGATVISSSY